MIRLLSLLFASLLTFDVKAGIKWFRGVTDKTNRSKKEDNEVVFSGALKRTLAKRTYEVQEILKLCDKNMAEDQKLTMDIRRLSIPRGGWTNSCAAGLLTITAVSMASRTFSASDCYSWYSLLIVASTCVVQKLRAENDLYYILGDLQVLVFRLLPFRLVSRMWGRMCAIYVTPRLRTSLYNFYIRTYNVNIEEALEGDLTTYNTMGDFFRRKINPSLRPIDPIAQVVSPVDGTIIYNGLLFDGTVQQVKGINYSIHKFLGPLVKQDGNEMSLRHYTSSLMKNPLLNHLYSCVVYLAPGDYHRFHSPAEWTLNHRRHFVGDLLSVNPFLLSWIPDLFVLNERVVMSGEWRHGFFSMTAVGATNVGSIVLYDDKSLETNKAHGVKKTFFDRCFKDGGITFSKGEPVGEFKLGSTVVMVFEAPKDFGFLQTPGKHIKYGESVLCL